MTQKVKAVNTGQQEAFDEMLRKHDEFREQMVAEHTPKTVTLTKHQDGEAPKEVAPGVFCMSGDYYSTEEGIVVAASDVEDENGAWQQV